jgi:hypothetical protein
MAILLPYLDITGPDGQQFRAELNKTHLTIGRLSEYNDISLEPDPQQLITRLAHCAIERTPAGWWVIDNGSVNRTFVRWGETMRVIEGGEPINDGAVICILGQLTESGDPLYWQLEFHDPLQTRRLQTFPLLDHLEYDWVQAKLFRITGRLKEEIDNLRPQEHKLIRYMDQRNRANGYVPVMCTYDELITAVWGEEEYGRTEADINRLVWELRQKIETDQKEPRFLETVRGLGYRLVTRATKG